MAELALAIIPLGITVTSGLVKYLKAFNDHNDDHARLVRQAEQFASTFRSLEVALKRPQLIPELSISASEASACLRECQKALEELDILRQKIFATSTSAVAKTSNALRKDTIKNGCKKLMYTPRKFDIEALQGALNKLSTTLNVALGMIHLNEQSLARKALDEQMAEIKENTIINSNTSAVVKELRHPITRIDSALPGLQTSVDSIVPQLNQRFDQISHQYFQMQVQIKSLLYMASATRHQDRFGTKQQFSYSHAGEQYNYPSARETESELPTISKSSGSVSMCSCQFRRVRQSKRFAMGPVHFSEETISILSHEKDCVFFIPSSGYQKTRTLRFTGMAALLKKGMEVSFRTHIRSGEFSISPSFTYFPVVDWKVAPAFLLMSLLQQTRKLKFINETRSRRLLSAAQQKLQELFCSGRASPNDVTQEGKTLLHHLSYSVHIWSRTLEGANSPFVRRTCEGLLDFLVAAGTSVTARDRSGDLALHIVIDRTFVPASIYGQLISGNDVEEHTNGYLSYLRNRCGLLDYYDHNQIVASSLAVIRNNLLEVERLISLHPHLLEELSLYGETPLHTAVYRSDILRALAKKANPEVFIQHDNDFATVLNVAIQVSSELSTGCPIIPHRDFSQDSHLGIPEWSFSEACFHCKTLLVKELRSRRRQLRDLAQNKLSIKELSNFTAQEEVPDIDAIEMDRLLRQKGILGLGPLSTFVDEDLPLQPGRAATYYSRSIFFDLTKPEDADLFLDSGFKMICTGDDYGSSLERALFDEHVPWIRYVSLDDAIWLFDHDAPLWKWSYRFTSPQPSIFVLADILGMQDYECPRQDNTKYRVENCLSESVSVDNCSCICSPHGCTPFTLRMKWLAHPYEQAEDLALQDYATRFASHVKVYGKSMNLRHHVIMVRQATFAALDLKHTCLDKPGYSRWPGARNWMYFLAPMAELEPDEREFELSNVDEDAMNQLEEVGVMFEDFVLTGCQTTALSKSGSCNVDYIVFDGLNVLGTDDIYYQRILKFWQHIWVNRMQLALDILTEKWINKHDGQNDLVQVSTCKEATQETRHSLEEEDDEMMFNRIIQQIQDI
ncbi:hypothetical protein F25303_7822 [Fusarium sp. NRRL 25303]|nr:hypothetical protein F25303_7822 [Fusarium sp. NRRL 25303]